MLIRAVSPDYFRAMSIRVESGRAFSERDRQDAPLVALVNRVLAERYFPDEDPIGKHVSLMGVSRQIVGVVGNVKQFGLANASEVAVYTPYPQESEEWLRRSMTFLVRTDGDPTLWGTEVRRAVREVDGSLPINDLEPMTTWVQHDVAEPRFRTVLLTVFAALALALASVGIGSVMAYDVAQRGREIAVRLAVGADAGHVVAMILRRAATLTAAGIGLGLLGALAAGQFLSSFLFGVTPYDPVVLSAVVAGLAVVAIFSSYLPARHATRIDPADALRGD